MHSLLFVVSMVWLAVLFGVCVVFIVRVRDRLTRVLVFDTLGLLLVAALALVAVRDGPAYLDAAIVIALVGFVSTMAAARYDRDRSVL